MSKLFLNYSFFSSFFLYIKVSYEYNYTIIQTTLLIDVKCAQTHEKHFPRECLFSQSIIPLRINARAQRERARIYTRRRG